ncbi:MAG: hypothetical protein V7K41_12065 [Nostoc sp.]|uniref:ImmA/IrrE family metallo-endopeptidase n=1 Tax=Nostoc sp. TaxID=1180 RepID=UPI002FF488A6
MDFGGSYNNSQNSSQVNSSNPKLLRNLQEFVISLKTDKKKDVEKRANNFAADYLMPPEFLQKIPDCRAWTSEKGIEWANKLRSAQKR